MAKKLILVDEDKYNALINQQKDEGNLNVLREDAEKALNKKTKNLSTKNINYQQTFRRYLKARKEDENKPVKAKLLNGINVIAKNTPTKTQIAVVNEEGEIEDGLINESPDFSTVKSTDYSTATENSPTPKAFPNLTARKLYEYLMKSPQKFKLTTSGRILRGKTPLKTANIRDIVLYMFEPKSQVPPAGYKLIITKLINDPYITQLIQSEAIKIPQVHNESTPRRPPPFSAKMRKYSTQTPTPRRPVVKNPVINKYKVNPFEPEEWT
jgi:hypothetical protein